MQAKIFSALERLGYSHIIEVTELKGGSVHYIYLITDSVRGNAIVKCRGSLTKEAIGVVISSEEVRHEAEGLKYFSGTEATLPILYGIDVESGILVMSLIVEQGTNLKTWIENHTMITVDTAFMILISVEKLLLWGKESDHKFVPEKEDGRFITLFMSRYKYQHQTVVKNLLNELLADNQNRMFIMGGLSFKNILFSSREYGFCDLETFCYGHPLFDIGYYLGHVLLHTVGNIKTVNLFFVRLEKHLLNSSILNPACEDVLVKVIILTMLYRLTHPKIFYAFKGRESLMKSVESLNSLLTKKASLSIGDLKAIIKPPVANR